MIGATIRRQAYERLMAYVHVRVSDFTVAPIGSCVASDLTLQDRARIAEILGLPVDAVHLVGTEIRIRETVVGYHAVQHS